MNEIIMKDYIGYWDKVIREWGKSSEVPESEKCWFSNKKSNLHSLLMPEPYWGNPDDCTAVILNYNPAGPKVSPFDKDYLKKLKDDTDLITHAKNKDKSKLAGVATECYSNIALKYPWVESSKKHEYLLKDSYDWYSKRDKWSRNLLNYKSDKSPFMMELCGWHSAGWTIYDLTDKKEYINKWVLPYFKKAIQNSQLGVGLTIGKQLGDKVLAELGFNDVTENLGLKGKVTADGWQPIAEVNRWYRVYCLDDSGKSIFVINTWAKGSNRQPADRFSIFEKQLIEKLSK